MGMLLSPSKSPPNADASRGDLMRNILSLKELRR